MKPSNNLENKTPQGFSQVLKHGGEALQNLIGEPKLIHGGSIRGRGLKMLLKNTCEGVYLIVKLPAISL